MKKYLFTKTIRQLDIITLNPNSTIFWVIWYKIKLISILKYNIEKYVIRVSISFIFISSINS